MARVETSNTTTAWGIWNTPGTATAGSTRSIWESWAAAQTSLLISPTGLSDVDRQPGDIRARRDADIEAEQKAVDRLKKEVEERQAAKERALKLLTESLNDKQRIAFEKDRCIPIDGESGNKYTVKLGRMISVLAPGGEKYHLCIHSKERIPEEDTALAQKLMLEADEGELLRIANKHP